MSRELVPIPTRDLSGAGVEQLPAAIGRAGKLFSKVLMLSGHRFPWRRIYVR
jgi:hypothetical protein